MIDGGRCVVLIGSALHPGTPISIGAPFADGSLLCIGAPVEAAAPIYARTPPDRGSSLDFGHRRISRYAPLA
jgi:hypothetical protein